MSHTKNPQQIDSETLELVFTEAKDAYSKLMADVDMLNARTDQQTQVCLIILGVYLTVGGGIVSSTLIVLVPYILLSAVLLAISATICLYTRARGRYFAGNEYPHILSERLTQKPEQVKQDFLAILSSSYFYNLETLRKKHRLLQVAAYFQIAGILLPVMALLFEVVVLVINVIRG